MSSTSSGWKAAAMIAPWATTTGPSSCSARTATPGPVDSTTGARMKTAWNGPSSRPVDGDVGFEAIDLTPVSVASNGDVECAEARLVRPPVVDLGGEQDQPGARTEHGQAVGDECLDLVEQAGRREQLRHRRALASGQHERVDSGEIARLSNGGRVVRRAQRAGVGERRTHPAGRAHRPWAWRCRAPGGSGRSFTRRHQPRSA